MKRSVTTGQFSRKVGDYYADGLRDSDFLSGDSLTLRQNYEDTRGGSTPRSGLIRFCEKYKETYCERCQVNCKARKSK